MTRPTRLFSGGSSRRDFLKYGAAGTGVLLAGCSGEDPAADGAADSSGSGSGDVRTFAVFDPLTSGASPTERHFNPWNPSQSGCWHPGANVFDKLAIYSPTRNEAYPLVAKSWKKTDDTTLEVTLKEGWTWHNGDDLVAQDWVMQMQIEQALKLASNPDADPLIEKVQAVDDYHIRIDIRSPLSEIFAVQNTIGMYNGNLSRGIFTKHDDERWSGWHEKLMNGSKSEKQSAIQELTSASYPMIDEAIGNGPFKIKAVGDNEIVMEVYEDHPNAGNIGFDQFKLKLFSSNRPFQPYSSGEVDAAHKGFPVQKDLRSRLPEGHTLFREGRSSNKLFAFNCGHNTSSGYESPVADHRVRQAIMHIFDKQKIEPLLQGVNRLFEWAPCRVPGKVLREGNVDVEGFVTYGKNDTKRATELLKAAGFKQDNLGNWLNPDGKRFEIKIMNGATRPDINILKKNLQEFGIKVTQEQVDDATFDERRKNGEYDIMPDGSSANGITAMWTPGLVVDWIKSITHYDPDAELPMPVGDPSGSSGTKKINVPNHIRQWMSTGEDKYHRELMWWWNQYLPEAEVMYQPDAGAYNGSEWKVDVRAGIKNGVDDALYVAPKMPEGTITYVGD